MRGSKILVESLKRVGVEVIFGITGGASMPIFDDLYDEPAIRVINTRHEQGAAHAADGYARATGKVGVAMSTSGPGATNLVTGIATAYMDSIPLVAITGQVATHLIGNDAFQECDVIRITRPICKHSYLIKSAQEIPRENRLPVPDVAIRVDLLDQIGRGQKSTAADRDGHDPREVPAPRRAPTDELHRDEVGRHRHRLEPEKPEDRPLCVAHAEDEREAQPGDSRLTREENHPAGHESRGGASATGSPLLGRSDLSD